MNSRTRETIIKQAFFATAATSLAVLALIMIFLFMEGLPTFGFISVKNFIFGMEWYPTDEARPDYGIFPLFAASGAVTVLSSLLAIPLGVMSAVYLAEIASPRVRAVAKPVVEMLASLPSVVIGFFGMVVFAPFLQEFLDIPVGLNLFNASVMLAFMSVPTIASVSEDAIYAVPRELKEASLALGATHLETLIRVTIPAALSGIGTAVILGMSRAIGETMVVLMVAGGGALVAAANFGPHRANTASIAAENAAGPVRGNHYHALFATAMVLFLVTLFFNVLADYISHKHRQAGSASL